MPRIERNTCFMRGGARRAFERSQPYDPEINPDNYHHEHNPDGYRKERGIYWPPVLIPPGASTVEDDCRRYKKLHKQKLCQVVRKADSDAQRYLRDTGYKFIERGGDRRKEMRRIEKTIQYEDNATQELPPEQPAYENQAGWGNNNAYMFPPAQNPYASHQLGERILVPPPQPRKEWDGRPSAQYRPEYAQKPYEAGQSVKCHSCGCEPEMEDDYLCDFEDEYMYDDMCEEEYWPPCGGLSGRSSVHLRFA